MKLIELSHSQLSTIIGYRFACAIEHAAKAKNQEPRTLRLIRYALVHKKAK